MISRCLSLAILLCCGPAVAADGVLFKSAAAMEIDIAAPERAIFRDPELDSEYVPAQLRYRDDSGIAHSLDIGLRPRGSTRRNPGTCQFPPLQLKFDAGQTAGTVFAGQTKLKMVAHCRSFRAEYRQHVLLEYLAYQTLNLLVDQSFRTRLLIVTYEYTDKKTKPMTSYAFLIEDRDQMAARNGKTVRKPRRTTPGELDPTAASLVAVFQYLIGNTDWSMLGNSYEPCCHNIVLIAGDDEPYVPVPFDFDYSGIVDAPYAAPGRNTGLRSVRTRIYWGFCGHLDRLEETLTRYNEKKEAIFQLYRQQAGLEPRLRRKTLKYLGQFYKTINDPQLTERRIVEACRYKSPLPE